LKTALSRLPKLSARSAGRVLSKAVRMNSTWGRFYEIVSELWTK
jgi:hypothetical protein